MLIDSRLSVQPMDEIFIPIDEHGRCRAVRVVENHPFGLEVVWFQPNGVGPHRLLLPHVMLNPVMYRPVSAGESKSHFKMSEAETIDNHNRIKKEIKD
jgi:hypothetical protein